MSIEKRTEKLDLNLSSLIRHMGLITTLTFGLLALIINYSLTNWLINLILIGLLVSYFVNIIYILIIFSISSSKKDEFIYELNIYKQLNDITSEIYNEYRKNFITLGLEFEKALVILNYSKDKIEDLRNTVRKLLLLINAELPKENELPYYKIKCSNIADLISKIQAVLTFIYDKVLFEHASYLSQESEDQLTNEQKIVKSFINKSYLYYERLKNYNMDLIYYEELELSDINIRNLMILNPYYLCNYLIDYSKRSIYQKYIEINSKKSNIINSYSKNIKRSYYIYIFDFILLSILMLYFVISMFKLTL